MRFDDRLGTLLGQHAVDASAKAALWAQIADVMAQDSERLSPDQRRAGFERLRLWRDLVPAERRRITAAALSYHPLPAEMVDLFADDSARIAAPVLARAQLPDAEWVRLIPGWPSTSRALLRERRDLPPQTCRLLAAYGSHDFALPGQSGEASAVGSPIQIRDLVARIEAYRREHMAPRSPGHQFVTIGNFRFESGSDGIVNWVEGAPRMALIGVSLADMAEPGGYGVDGHAAGACRQRTQFRDAHLEVAGVSEVSGTWLISANPLFNPDDGRFLGYRGVARRPDAGSARTTRLLGSGLSADSVRQLAHELRTPLNAIRGFGEMIEGQFLGPVSHHYSDMARKIVGDAARLMGVIEDLDSAARLETGDWPEDHAPEASVDLREILSSITNELRPLIEDHDVRLRIALGQENFRTYVDRVTCTRLMGRLLSSAIEMASMGEVLTARLEFAPAGIAFRVNRPASLTGLSPEQIVATASVNDEAGSADLALGLGFAMRLIDAMARRVGGSLDIGRERFSLILPCVADSSGESKESG